MHLNSIESKSISNLTDSTQNKHHVGAATEMLWVWQTNSDLRFVDVNKTGLAILVATIEIKENGFKTKIRRNSVEHPPAVYILPVIRIETKQIKPNFERIEKLVQEIVYLKSSSPDLQIDFDATLSQRSFYLQLLKSLRRKVTSLSVTALASWCMQDVWLPADLVDEVVPMLFDLSHDYNKVQGYLRRHRRFSVDQCNKALGLASYSDFYSLKNLIRPVNNKRLYLFHKHGWTEKRYKEIKSKIENEF